MLFSVQCSSPFQPQTDLVIYSFFEGELNREEIAPIADQAAVKALLDAQKITGKAKEILSLYRPHETQTVQRILFLGLGEKSQWNEKQITEVIKTAVSLIKDAKVKTVNWNLLDHLPSRQCNFAIDQLIHQGYAATYEFDQYKTEKKSEQVESEILLTLTQEDDSKSVDAILAQIQQSDIIAYAVQATKQLANQPSNVCNARYLAEQGEALAKEYPAIDVTVYGEKEMETLNMAAYLAVGRGSANESIMTVMDYRGAEDKQAKPIVLVGKGLTFDSGGISLKPGAGMDEMKYDMCGAATVYGVMRAIAALQLPINVIGVMAGCENMPDANAYRPGDILTTMSGKTVEVINTDAEGRLVLCDVLTFVERFSPRYVIDIATLTGACIIGLGHHYSAVLGNDETLIESLLTASKVAKDKAWQLPMDDQFQEQIKSTCADILNSAGRDGGTITAACFLSQFTQNYPWAHLDIAGTAWTSGAKKGATGRPVALLTHFLIQQANQR